MANETWLSGTEAAKYFNIRIGNENQAVAAVQDYTKMYCHNTPTKLLDSGSNTDDNNAKAAADAENAAAEAEMKNNIAKLAIEAMAQ